MDKPWISIITVVFNGRKVLERTIESIVRQSYSKIEYIVIDGGSKDGTLELIKKYKSYITYWKSEPDKGIYDAMNKGLEKATGDYVWFINAGDEVYDANTLENIFTSNIIRADAYYGDVEYTDAEGNNLGTRTLKKPPATLNWKSFERGMVVSHQSILIKRSITVPYNLEYKHCADVDWTIRSLKNSKSIVNTGLILSKFLIGGYSKKNILPSNFERLKIMFKHFNFWRVIRVQFLLLLDFLAYFFTNKRKYY